MCILGKTQKSGPQTGGGKGGKILGARGSKGALA